MPTVKCQSGARGASVLLSGVGVWAVAPAVPPSDIHTGLNPLLLRPPLSACSRDTQQPFPGVPRLDRSRPIQEASRASAASSG